MKDDLEIPPKPIGRADYGVKLLDPQPADRVLNVGCFDGGFEFHYLNGKVTDFRGIDLNREAVAFARAWAQRVLGEADHFQVAPAEKIPFADRTFSKVLCLDTFEHVNDERQVADEIFRVLKPGGHLVLSVPHDFLNFLDPDNLTRGVRNLVRKYVKKKPLLDHPEHRHYSEKQLASFFNKFEFEAVHKCGTPIFWALAMAYTALPVPKGLVRRLSRLTAPLENWDYKTALPTGFNIMIKLKKP